MTIRALVLSLTVPALLVAGLERNPQLLHEFERVVQAAGRLIA